MTERECPLINTNIELGDETGPLSRSATSAIGRWVRFLRTLNSQSSPFTHGDFNGKFDELKELAKKLELSDDFVPGLINLVYKEVNAKTPAPQDEPKKHRRRT